MDPISLIPTHFEQLKELRNGTISYIQIIKRDQTRPPVRPVCRKLGVTKLSEIKSEADLYDALVSVAHSQSNKVKEQPEAHNNYSDAPYSARSYDSDMSHRSYNGETTGYSSKSGVHAYQSVSSKGYYESGPSSQRNSLSSLESSGGYPEFSSLLECVLNIRVAWDPRDPTQRLEYFAHKYALDEVFLLNSLRNICEMLGCVHLSPQIDVEQVINATKLYFTHITKSDVTTINSRYKANPTESFRNVVFPSQNNYPLNRGYNVKSSHDYPCTTVNRNNSLYANREAAPIGLLVPPAVANTPLSPHSPSYPQSSPYYGSPRESEFKLQLPLSQSPLTSGSSPYHQGPQSSRLMSGPPTLSLGTNIASTNTSPRYINEDISARATVNGLMNLSYDKYSSTKSVQVSNQYPVTARSLNGGVACNNPPSSLGVDAIADGLNNLYVSPRVSFRPVGGDAASEGHSQYSAPPQDYSSKSILSRSREREVAASGTVGQPHSSMNFNYQALRMKENVQTVLNVFETFWDRSFYLMISISNADLKCVDSINILKDLSNFVSKTYSWSPLVAIMFDSVLYRSVEEICAKVDKFSAINNGNNNNSSCTSNNNNGIPKTAKENIVLCIEVLNSFLDSPQYSHVKEIYSMSCKKLMKSLMDLVNWCGNSSTQRRDMDVLRQSASNNQVSGMIDEGLWKMKQEALLDEDQVNAITSQITGSLASGLSVKENKGPAFEPIGAAVIGLGDHASTCIDLVGKYSDACANELECIKSRKDVVRRIAVLENGLLQELQFDAAVKQVQQAILEQKNAIKDIIRIRKSLQTGNQTSAVNLIYRIENDYELFFRAGEKNLESAQQEANNRRKQPQLKALLDHLQYLKTQATEITMSIDVVKTQTLLNLSSNLIKLGFHNVHIDKKFQDASVHFTFNSHTVKSIPCAILINKLLCPHSSRLVKAYYDLDESKKIRLFAGIIQSFVRVHELNTELSSYAWNILVIHFLLRFGYLDNLQTIEYSTSSLNPTRMKVNDVDVTISDRNQLSQASSEKLAQTTLLDLVLRFFKYYSCEGDVFANVFTLRGKGQVIPKAGWSKVKPKVQWRLSVEDPFETGISENPNDLGCMLTFSGQAKVFKCLRMGWCALLGLFSVSRDLISDCLKMLTQRDKLASLAVVGGFKDTDALSPRDQLELLDTCPFMSANFNASDPSHDNASDVRGSKMSEYSESDYLGKYIEHKNQFNGLKSSVESALTTSSSDGFGIYSPKPQSRNREEEGVTQSSDDENDSILGNMIGWSDNSLRKNPKVPTLSLAGMFKLPSLDTSTLYNQDLNGQLGNDALVGTATEPNHQFSKVIKPNDSFISSRHTPTSHLMYSMSMHMHEDGKNSGSDMYQFHNTSGLASSSSERK